MNRLIHLHQHGCMCIHTHKPIWTDTCSVKVCMDRHLFSEGLHGEEDVVLPQGDTACCGGRIILVELRSMWRRTLT